MQQYRKTFRDYPKEGREYGKWFYVENGDIPPNLEVVIVEYSGYWNGNGGIVDLYWYGDDWFNYPEGVKINRWMWIQED